MWTSLFGWTNLIAVLGWAALLFLPRRPFTHSLILFAGVGLLCLIYAALLVLLVAGFVDPGAGGARPFDYSDYSIGGIRALFGTDAGIVVGWIHYLAFDLVVGLWIGRDADHKGFSRLVQAPFLLMTFLAGPFGLLLWLLVRDRRSRKLNRAAQS